MLGCFTHAWLLYTCFTALLMLGCFTHALLLYSCFAHDLLLYSCFTHKVAEPRLLYSCFTALLMLYSRRSLRCSRARKRSSDCRRLTKLRASTAGRIYAFWKSFFLFSLLEISNCNRHTHLRALFPHAGFIYFYFQKYFIRCFHKKKLFDKKNETWRLAVAQGARAACGTWT